MRLAIILITTLTLSGCDFFAPEKITWHQKLTLTVETPEGIKTASAVHEGRVGRQTWWRNQWGLGGGSGLSGEAVVLEIAPSKFLFVVQHGTPLAINIFNQPLRDAVAAAENLQGFRGSQPVPPDKYPLFVTFDDVANPMTVKRVEPNKLDAAFGRGYRFVGLEMTITGEPVSYRAMDAILPWLGKYYDKQLDGNTVETADAPNRLANSLSSGTFTTKITRN